MTVPPDAVVRMEVAEFEECREGRVGIVIEEEEEEEAGLESTDTGPSMVTEGKAEPFADDSDADADESNDDDDECCSFASPFPPLLLLFAFPLTPFAPFVVAPFGSSVAPPPAPAPKSAPSRDSIARSSMAMAATRRYSRRVGWVMR